MQSDTKRTQDTQIWTERNDHESTIRPLNVWFKTAIRARMERRKRAFYKIYLPKLGHPKNLPTNFPLPPYCLSSYYLPPYHLLLTTLLHPTLLLTTLLLTTLLLTTLLPTTLPLSLIAQNECHNTPLFLQQCKRTVGY